MFVESTSVTTTRRKGIVKVRLFKCRWLYLLQVIISGNQVISTILFACTSWY